MKTFIHAFHLNRLMVMVLSIALVSWAGAVSAAEFDQAYTDYDSVLKRFVADGLVDYKGLKSDSDVLVQYLDSAADVPEAVFISWEESERLAFLINLYNAATLKLIIDHYPVKSIKDIGSFFKGPWDQPVVRLFGDTITLNNLEHDIVRKQYDEPRIHMALVCAARGCPPLLNEAYIADKLDEQLNLQSQVYLSSPAGLRIDRKNSTVYFSSIFKWYGEDFIAGDSTTAMIEGLDKTESAVSNFCIRYLTAADNDYLKAGGYSVKYLDYDWSLNTQSTKTAESRLLID